MGLSAKDLAFKREREKWQSEKNKIKIDLLKEQDKIDELSERLKERDILILTLREQNEELLQLCKMTPEEIKQYIEDKRKVAAAAESLSGMMDIIGGIGF